MYAVFSTKKLLVLCMAAILLIAGVLLPFCLFKESAISTAGGTIQLPVIMYHGLTESSKKRNKYFIPPEYFESDLIWLRKNGYQTIFVSELVEHFKNGALLPEKPVLLTFDDGYYDNYIYAFPLLKKYGMKAVISPIGSAADKAENEEYRSVEWSQCTWEQLREMTESGLVQLENHTYDLHSISEGVQGAARRSGENDEEYENRLKADLELAGKRIEEMTGRPPCAIVYPFGAKSKGTDDIICSMGFEAALDCEEKMNMLSSGEDLFHIHRFLRPDDISSEEFFSFMGKT